MIPETSSRTSTSAAATNGDDQQRAAVLRIGRERLLRYVTDIVNKQNTPLRDIIRDHALPFLPVQSLRRLSAVSAAWNRHISAPFFAHTQSHSHRALSGIFYPSSYPAGDPAYLPFDPKSHAVPDPSLSFLPDTVAVASSSNGLLACRSAVSYQRGPPRYYTCNPATADWTALPTPAHLRNGAAITLVFRPSALNFSADYYLICAVSQSFTFEVFSSKTGTWRLSNAVLPDEAAQDRRSLTGVAVGGVAYWRTKKGSVVSYDPAIDGFCVIGKAPTETPRWQLGEMDGKLCYVGAGEGIVEVYSLEEDGRRTTAAAWRRLATVEVSGDVWPLGFEGREELAVVWVDERVVGIEVRSGTARVVVDGGVPHRCTDGVPYISSLAAVREFCSGPRCFTCPLHAQDSAIRGPINYSIEDFGDLKRNAGFKDKVKC